VKQDLGSDEEQNGNDQRNINVASAHPSNGKDKNLFAKGIFQVRLNCFAQLYIDEFGRNIQYNNHQSSKDFTII